MLSFQYTFFWIRLLRFKTLDWRQSQNIYRLIFHRIQDCWRSKEMTFYLLTLIFTNFYQYWNASFPLLLSNRCFALKNYRTLHSCTPYRIMACQFFWYDRIWVLGFDYPWYFIYPFILRNLFFDLFLWASEDLNSYFWV